MSRDEPTKRFSVRVDDYVKYRPSYPTALIDCLRDECGLTATSAVADIGSGTGLLTQLYLNNGNPVWGVEPNPDMRRAGERFLKDYARFTSVAGSAEATTLATDSVDFVVAGQAAHWFEAAPARREFQRILKPGGVLSFVWNTRAVAGSDFMRAYEQALVTYAREDTGRAKRAGGHERVPETILGEGMVRRSFHKQQQLDFASLKGRTLSSSMTPLADHPNYVPLLAALQVLFETYQVDGRVTMLYETELFYNRMRGWLGKVSVGTQPGDAAA